MDKWDINQKFKFSYVWFIPTMFLREKKKDLCFL